MGNSAKNQTNEFRNFDLLESWEYEGKISEFILYKSNKYVKTEPIYLLSGKICIKSVKGKKLIEIKGEIKVNNGNYYEFYGEEISIRQNKKDENIMFFQIKKKSNFELNKITIIKNNNGNGILIGENIAMKNINNNWIKAYLNLDLYKYKEYNINSLKISEPHFKASKIIEKDNPKDILENSLCGMKNLINTCYINSSFQILIHIPEFIDIIRNHSDFEENIIDEINKIYNQILKLYNKNRPVINPHSFVNFFKSNHSQYHNYSQMDSEMFLEELIWDINIEIGNLGEKRTNNSDWKNKKTEKERNFYNYVEESELETNFQINDLFYVYFIHEKKCKNCKNCTYYYDEIPGLKLNFERKKDKSTIDLHTVIMDNFKNPITYKSNILCEKCQKSSNIIETTRIAKLPKILILSLQKANSENTQKIPWLVKFDKDLGIREIVDIDIIKNESCRYEIFAINNHLGNSPISGHYFSQIFLKKLKNWYSFNDESVNIDSDYFPNLNNYILFYKQK